jgi:hypothetical protein
LSDVVRDFISQATALLVPLSSVPADPGYGIDLICVTDLDQRLLETAYDSNESLSQDLFHRVTTKRGSLADDLDYGIDLRGMLSSAQLPETLLNLQAAVEQECAKDPRVRDVSCSAVWNAQKQELNVSIAVRPYALTAVNGFQLIMTVTSGSAILESISNASATT